MERYLGARVMAKSGEMDDAHLRLHEAIPPKTGVGECLLSSLAREISATCACLVRWRAGMSCGGA